jgi:hypothetical protein
VASVAVLDAAELRDAQLGGDHRRSRHLHRTVGGAMKPFDSLALMFLVFSSTALGQQRLLWWQQAQGGRRSAGIGESPGARGRL